MIGKTVEELSIGEKSAMTRTISEGELALFAGATGDLNPVHFDEEYAKGTFLKGRIAHGMLAGGLISAVLANRLPGVGSIYLSQTLKFLAPVYPGDDVTARVTVREIDHSKRRVTLDCVCLVREKAVLKGEALVLAPSKKFD